MVFSFKAVFRNFNNWFSGSKQPYRTVKGCCWNYNLIIWFPRTYSKMQVTIGRNSVFLIHFNVNAVLSDINLFKGCRPSSGLI